MWWGSTMGLHSSWEELLIHSIPSMQVVASAIRGRPQRISPPTQSDRHRQDVLPPFKQNLAQLSLFSLRGERTHLSHPSVHCVMASCHLIGRHMIRITNENSQPKATPLRTAAEELKGKPVLLSSHLTAVGSLHYHSERVRKFTYPRP